MPSTMANKDTADTVDTVDTVDGAARQLAGGGTVLVLDDTGDPTTGVLVSAAEHATISSIAFAVRHTSGLLCAAMPAARLDALELPPMPPGRTGPAPTDRSPSRFRVAVDAARGISTGISAADRALTMRVLADPSSTPTDLVRPGHVLPVRADGLLDDPTPAAAAVALLTRAGLAPVGMIATVVDDDGELPSQAQLRRFAERHALASVSVRELVDQHARDRPVVRRETVTRLPTRHGEFLVHGYRDFGSGAEHLAVVHGAVDVGADLAAVEPVHLRNECPVGHALGSIACGCGERLDEILERIAGQGRGVLVYLRPPVAHADGTATGSGPEAVVAAIIDDVLSRPMAGAERGRIRCG